MPEIFSSLRLRVIDFFRELAVRGATWKRRKSLSLPDSLMVIRITLLQVTLSVSCHTNGFPLKMVVSGVWHLNKVDRSD